jgi:Spx/MgsR family transcriptional regulator
MYGIPNCDTVKKASVWLKQNNLPFTFHDYKKQGITSKKLKEWCKHFGWENVLNKNSTTWKELSGEQRNAIKNVATAINLMSEKPSIIKRPIVEANGNLLLRFNEAEYRQVLL